MKPVSAPPPTEEGKPTAGWHCCAGEKEEEARVRAREGLELGVQGRDEER